MGGEIRKNYMSGWDDQERLHEKVVRSHEWVTRSGKIIWVGGEVRRGHMSGW